MAYERVRTHARPGASVDARYRLIGPDGAQHGREEDGVHGMSVRFALLAPDDSARLDDLLSAATRRRAV